MADETMGAPPPIAIARVAACVAAGTLALVVMGLMPLLYSAYVSEGTISAQRLGLLGAIELLAITLGSGAGVLMLRKPGVRPIALVGVFLLCCGNLLVAKPGDTELLFLFRTIAGSGAGLLVGVAASAIARTNRIGAWAGIYLFGQSITQFAVMRWFAIYAPGSDGAQIQLALALMGIITIAIIPFFPARFSALHADSGTIQGLPAGRGLLGLVAAFLCIGGAGGAWAYLELWMHGQGVSHSDGAHLLSLALLGQIFGSVAGTFIADGRLSWLRLLAIILALGGTSTAWLQAPSSEYLAFSFGLFFALGAPAFTGVLVHLDPEKRAYAYSSTAQFAGVAVIPTIAGETLAPHSLTLVIVACTAMVFASAAIISTQIPHLLRKQRDPA
ncbi:hypothetical protein [Sphingopyxis kveilinensis]|uniref:hypothetical protein n=1 Tax=Sphingopyxis kveilinensis TaxID=3114367 RepID=UPI0030CB2CA9